MRRLKITACTIAACLLLAGSLLAVSAIVRRTPTAHAAALTTNWYGSAPYVMPLDNTPPDLSTVMSATGEKAFELAFILDSGGCTPAWDGTAPVSSDTTVAGVINGVRAGGGDVSVSAGGYGGTKLGQNCGSPAATAAAYQQVITKYGLHAIDFDLEEPEIENATAINNELGAAQILQQNNSGLYVSVTIPSTTTGANYFGQLLLNNAKSLGFTPNNYSIMPFDGGFNGSSSQITALEDFHSQLMNTFGWGSATAYAHEGVSQMNGRSDSGEYFYQSDFQNVLSYATSHGLSRYTFWSVNRDRQCNPPDNNGTTSGSCSSVTQNAWDFTKYDAQFAGATPPNPTPQPTATSQPTAPPATATPTSPPAATPTPTTGGGSGSGNLISNGGFESGSLAPWTCDAGTGAVVSSPVHSGAHALQLAPTGSDDAQCTQTVSVQPNHTYTLTAYVQGNYAFLGVVGSNSNWTNSASYTPLSVSFTTGASTTSVTVYVHGWYLQGNVYVDDVTLQ